MDDARHSALCRRLEIVCLCFVALGVALPLAWQTAAFSVYRDAAAGVIGDAALLEGPTSRLVVGITGGSIAGKWAMHWALARFGLRARLRWAWNATLVGLLVWFFVDSTASLLAGAWANVVMINGLPPLLVLPLAWRLRASCDRDEAPSVPALRPITLVATATALIGVVTGLVIAFGTSTPVFDPWWQGLHEAHFASTELPDGARALVGWFAGPIGGSTAGQCAMMAIVARRAIGAGEPWAWRWSALSVAAWAITDSTWSLLAGGAFNVWLVNLPCVVLLVSPLLWAGLRRGRAR